MFSENNLGIDYSSISKHELRLRVCNNERDLDEISRSFAKYCIDLYIDRRQKTMMNQHPLVNMSRITKFKDLCNKDIVGSHFSITDVINKFDFVSGLSHEIADHYTTHSNFRKYSLPIFIILGLLGNCLSAIVLFRKKMRSSSSNIYLGMLAICDIAYSMILLIDWLFLLGYINPERIYLYCLYIFVNFLFSFSEFLSVWLIVAFTIERYIVTKYPLLRRSWCTVKRAKIVVIILMGLAILNGILNIFYNFENKHYEILRREMNSYDIYKLLQLVPKKIQLIKKITDSITIFSLPALVIVICNFLIGYHIYQQNRVRKTLFTASDSSNERTQISKDKMLQHKITKMLILVSSIFLILKLPVHYFYYFRNYFREYVDVFVVITIFDLLDTAHYSINFVLYCATGQTFHRELIHMFTKRTNMRKNRNIREMYNYK
ncbi:sex peptide receptor-like [Linepithema humile]|uniref:sex peptide receptor-like n=1 Tax=Linepithema humile TaxID=83485 RepID=UPI00351DC20D